MVGTTRQRTYERPELESEGSSRSSTQDESESSTIITAKEEQLSPGMPPEEEPARSDPRRQTRSSRSSSHSLGGISLGQSQLSDKPGLRKENKGTRSQTSRGKRGIPDLDLGLKKRKKEETRKSATRSGKQSSQPPQRTSSIAIVIPKQASIFDEPETSKTRGAIPVKNDASETSATLIEKDADNDTKVVGKKPDMGSTKDHESRFKRHYYYHSGNPKWLALDYVQKERLYCHWCQIIKFSTHKRYPISITNNEDNETLPRNFQFIETPIFGEEVEAAEEDFRTGCECDSDADCKFIGCHCLQDMIAADDADANDKIFSYHSEGIRKECLRGAKLDSRDPIYECHRSCACSEKCSNRVVERGRKVPLNIFRTDDGRGWGVKSNVHIQKGQFIDKYLGEIITSEVANQRRQESDVAKRKDVYLFALDKFSDPDSMDPRLAGPAYEVDGEFYSGPTRFINHSCDPNLRSFARVGDHADKHIHDLAFFAIEDIPAGTELTFDYVDGEDTELMEDSNDPEKLKDMTKCLCGSDNCRGFLW